MDNINVVHEFIVYAKYTAYFDFAVNGVMLAGSIDRNHVQMIDTLM